MKVKTDVVAALREIIETTGMKQNVLAEHAGISQAYLSDVLNGRRNLTPTLLERLLGVLGASPRLSKTMHRMGARAAGWIID